MLVGLGGCSANAAFECERASDCVSTSGAGMCQADGFCSFPAEDCDSGQRYGDHSGPAGGQCVPPDDAAPTTSASTSTTADATDGLDMQTTGTTGAATTMTEGSPDSSETDGSTSETTSSTATDSGEQVDPDLVLWLKLDEVGDSVAADASMYAHDGSCDPPGCPVGTAGAEGDGMQFDGVDDVVTVPDAPHLSTPDALTVSCWILLDAMPLEHRAVLAKPLGGEEFNTFELYFFGSTTNRLRFGMAVDPTATDNAIIDDPLPIGEWFHVAGTWDGQDMAIWLDGVLVTSQPHVAYASSTSPVLVGADDDAALTGPEAFFDGGIDDVRIYARALDADEIAALAAGRD